MRRWAPATLLLLLLGLATTSADAQTSPRSRRTPGNSPAAGAGAGATWIIDTSQSRLTFSVRHVGDRVEGRFGQWGGTLTLAADKWADGTANVTIQTASINTGNRSRDNHLRSDDFFDAARYPTITFKSTRVTRTGDSVAIAGNLTMRGVTKPVVLTGKFLGIAGTPARIAFKVSTTVNRLDFGVAYNRIVEGGGTILGDDVKIDISLVAVQQS